MTITEQKAHSVIADRFDPDDFDQTFPRYNPLLTGAMPLHLSAGAFDPKILGRQEGPRVIVEFDTQQTVSGVKPDRRSDRHQSSSLRASSGSMIGIPSRTG